MQMLYNGKIELYYLTTGYRTFASMLPSLDGAGFTTVVTNLLHAIIEVKNNGFLSYQNIDISFDKIYVDPSNFSVGLIYVPINVRAHKDFASFETEVRTSLGRLINSLPSLQSQKISRLYLDLSNGTLTLEALVSRSMAVSSGPSKEHSGAQNSVLTLVAMDAPQPLELLVNKDEYVIGKSELEVDGVISFNNAISRFHCKLIRSNGSFLLEDLESLNGTYVNKVRLQPHAPVAVTNGDIVQLANSKFQVRIM
ncbi:FHA domain-containing protein [Paenibacillus sp. TRM 82003]|nr:FHA domain-containing protein [Paenibacillus sp. TRM 82003]